MSHLCANSGLRSKDDRILQLKESQTGGVLLFFISLYVLIRPSVDCLRLKGQVTSSNLHIQILRLYIYTFIDIIADLSSKHQNLIKCQVALVAKGK